MGEYEHTVRFSPRGVSLHDASETRTITFCSDSLRRDDVRREARRRAIDRGLLSTYALRNHWDIAEMSADFADAPWGSYAELGEEVVTFPGAWYYGSGQGDLSEEPNLFVTVHPERMDAFLDAAEEYFAPMNPRQYRRWIALLTINPRYID